MERKDVEIMAPVGSYESLVAAIQAGAGSVYFGVEKLNMRARSSHNFTLDDLKEIVLRSDKVGVKTYLTVNTGIFDDELDKIREIIVAAKESGVSAVIASDMGVIQMCREQGVEVHMSTQVNITNYAEVKFYSQFADVMVLAREMTLDRVAEITKRIERDDLKGPSGKRVRLEMFVHGALCMAISGKCYLSLHETGSSANRGACMQTCRRAYIVTDKETGHELEIDNEYIMSPKDLKTIHFLNKILDSGVSVLKIEGRARSAEYVKTVAECYREAVDAYFDGTFGKEKIDNWNVRLSTVFNRGFWDGYYLGQRLGEWSHNYGSRATKKRMYIGKGTNYFSKLEVAEFKMETQSLNVGDEILITGPTTGVVQMTVPEIRVDEKPVEETRKGEYFSMPLEVKIRRSDKLYKIVDASEVKSGRSK
ncbi:peptidase U32 family protein [Prolixibacter sp. SD074]|uniref:peptidase U32 family protein n=1 Tax=Prolixibacter sp. SD074 TaxID=2652391 RepID=UPI00127947CA|nr:peptidase U32 family protein [Prolixibacter sp. SD074]GET30595.1 collagenase [Prolixibacter sp. SD074]